MLNSHTAEKMKELAIVKKRSNGNVEYKVLNDIDTDMRWLKWSIIFLIVAVLCPLFLKSLGVISVDIVAGILAAIGIVIFLYLVFRGHSLGKKEEKFVINLINDVVIRDAEGRKLKVRKVKFCSDTLDSYGTIDEEYVLALFDNETVLKYPIRQLNKKDERYKFTLD